MIGILVKSALLEKSFLHEHFISVRNEMFYQSHIVETNESRKIKNLISDVEKQRERFFFISAQTNVQLLGVFNRKQKMSQTTRLSSDRTSQEKQNYFNNQYYLHFKQTKLVRK